MTTARNVKNLFDLGGKTHPGWPEQAKLFDEIMSRLDRPAGIYGWSEPEAGYCDRISRDGNFIISGSTTST